MTKQFRVNATLSESHSNYLDEKSAESGISKSALVSIAVDEWIKQEQAMERVRERFYEEQMKKIQEETSEKLKK